MDWKKLGKKAANFGLEMMESSSRQQRDYLRTAVKKKNLSEKQRACLEEKLYMNENLVDRIKITRENYFNTDDE